MAQRNATLAEAHRIKLRIGINLGDIITKMMLDHYQQTKNMLVSYSPKKLGFF